MVGGLRGDVGETKEVAKAIKEVVDETKEVAEATKANAGALVDALPPMLGEIRADGIKAAKEREAIQPTSKEILAGVGKLHE
eukprot:2462123-Prymnesium_polylepis.1